MAQKLQNKLQPSKGGRTVRGGAFHAGFKHPESTEKDSAEANDIKKNEKVQTADKNRQKRSGTCLQMGSTPKKAMLECPACGIKGHKL